MEDVLKTVSELKFRSIAMIAAVILLALAAVWWLLGGPASPPQIRQSQRATAGRPSVAPLSPPTSEAQPSGPTETSAKQSAKPEVLVVEGPPSGPSVLTAPGSGAPTIAETTGQFTVQVGAFEREGGALQRQAELRSKGYESSLVAAENEDAVSFRLITGNFATHAEASKIVTELKLAGIDAFVRSTSKE